VIKKQKIVKFMKRDHNPQKAYNVGKAILSAFCELQLGNSVSAAVLDIILLVQ